MAHPAQFHPNILAAIKPHLAELDGLIFDPFAGTGIRLGQMCDELGKPFKGIDIENWPDHDPRITIGDASNIESYPGVPFTVVTSPTYPNGISDHFKPSDKSKRFTYRTALGQPLQENNTGRYSVRGGKKQMEKYWLICYDAIYNWVKKDANVFVNVKNFYHQGEIVDLVHMWKNTLSAHGYLIDEVLEVECPGIRFGANSKARVDHESIIIGHLN